MNASISLIFLPILFNAINSAIIPQIDQQEEIPSRPGFGIIGLLRGPSTVPNVDADEYRAIIDGLLTDKGKGRMVEESVLLGAPRNLMLRRANGRHQMPRRFSFLDAGRLMGGGFVPNAAKRFSRIGGNIMMGRK